VRRRTFQNGQEGLLQDAVAAALGLPISQARSIIERGAVYIRGRRQRSPIQPVAAGLTVSVVLEEAGRSALTPTAPPSALRVLFEDELLLAVDKPAGLPAQPTPGGARSLLDQATEWLGRPAGLVHRLDRDTTGVTVFGKTREATSALAQAFRTGQVRKQYLAVTGPTLAAEGVCTVALARDPSRPGRWRRAASGSGVPAETRFRRLGGTDQLAVAALWPRTGRTHQLRAHLASLGAPIAGDRLYGGQRTLDETEIDRVLLHAHMLGLPASGNRGPVAFEAPLPEDMRRWFDLVGLRPPGDLSADGY
jgi:23S rRNA pseudouridine1911/1915/1917 synthase